MLVVAAIGACTGSDPEPAGPPPVVNNNYFGPDGSSSSSGAVTSSSGSGTSSSTSSSGGDAGSDASPSGSSIRCGGDSCVRDSFCCIDPENADPVCLPEGTPCSAPSEMHCDSADDCAPGKVCCATSVASSGGVYWRSSCDTLVAGYCPGSGRVLCRSATRDCVGFEIKCETAEPTFRPVGYDLCK